jgi:putative Holliday junction resolvase
MAQVLAIDYGKKRTGIAVTDDLQIIASGLPTISTDSLISFLEHYFTQEKVESLVIGQSNRLHGELSEIEVDIQELISTLNVKFPNLPIFRQDERFTSKIAMDAMVMGGVKKKDRRDKKLGIVDKVSAVLILQAFLENKRL